MPPLDLRHPFARFAIVGCANFVVSFSTFYASYHLLPTGLVDIRAAMANVLAYGAGLLNSFVLNRLWTFRAGGSMAAHAMRFALLNAVTLVAGTVILLVLVDWAGLPPVAVWLPLTLATLTTHYLGMKHWAFAPRA